MSHVGRSKIVLFPLMCIKYIQKYFCYIQVGQDDVIKAPVTKCDTGTQTDTHFMESNIVKSYEWNEWELRRKAIKLVS